MFIFTFTTSFRIENFANFALLNYFIIFEMIQRVQSIFLAFIIVCMVTVIFMPLWQKVDTNNSLKVELTALGTKYVEGTQVTSTTPAYYLAILAGLSAVVALLSLLNYKNRLRQLQFGMLNALLMATLMGLTVYQISKAEQLLLPGPKGDFTFAFWFIVVALIANVIANRFIHKDEKLLRSADSIR